MKFIDWILRIVGLLTILYLGANAAGLHPETWVRQAKREIKHAVESPAERTVSKGTEAVEDAVDAAKRKLNSK